MSLLLSAVEARYWYDGDGTLVKSEINGMVTYFAGRHYHKIVDGENETIRKFYTAGSAQIAVRTNGVLTWVLSDHLGSTSVIANEDGTFKSEIRYTAFGEVRQSSGTTETPYQYTGQLSQMDEIGLYYYVARWYDATFTRKRQLIDLLDVRGTLALENNEKVVYVSCKLLTEQQQVSLALTSPSLNIGGTATTPCASPPTAPSP